MVELNRTLPHNLDAEKSVLGAVLMHDDALALVSGFLKPNDFFRDAHRRVYVSMLALAERRVAIDFVTLMDELTKHDDLTEVGGPAYLAALVDGLPKSTNIEHYARVVRGKAMLRELIYAANKILATGYEAEQEPADALQEAEGLIYGIAEREDSGSMADGDQMAQEGYDLLERLQATGKLAGLQTGLIELDNATLGLHATDLTILAARPGNGKSALMMAIAREVAIHQQQVTAVFSLEMSREQLVLRMLSSEGRLDAHQLRSGALNPQHYQTLGTQLSRIKQSQLFVDDTPGRSVMQIRSQCRRLKARAGGLKLVMIDYLQLMRPAHHRKEQNREQEVAGMAWGCKELAKELNVPVVLLSQLKRPEDAKTREPRLEDLRESGAIEQHADNVLFLHPPAQPDGTCRLIIGKQRNGPRTKFDVGYEPAQFQFRNLATQQEVF